jgi:bifunctional non-homologous end joining protein LigD
LLQNALSEKDSSSMIYYVFDLIYSDGYNLTNTPLVERKKLLNELIPSVSSPSVRYSDHVIGNGPAVFKNACKLHLEGIISKAADSPYTQKRTRDWLKIKCISRQEFVIGGFTKPKGSRKFFGSLLLGYYGKDKKLHYCGHVGTGFNEESLSQLAKKLEAVKTTKMPFVAIPKDVKNATWVKPNLVAEVKFLEWTRDGILRHPSFKGLREDKSPKKIIREVPK